MPLALIFSLLVLGFSGIAAQTVLIRESLIIFGGNELSLGIIIGAGVIWEALGAYAGGRLPRTDARVTGGLITANILFVLFFPATIAAIRTLKITIGLVPEMSLGIISIFASSLVIFLPSALSARQDGSDTIVTVSTISWVAVHTTDTRSTPASRRGRPW